MAGSWQLTVSSLSIHYSSDLRSSLAAAPADRPKQFLSQLQFTLRDDGITE